MQKGYLHRACRACSGYSGHSMQWMQYAMDAVEYWYMVVGTLSLVQKGQTRGCSGRSGHSTQWKLEIWQSTRNGIKVC